LKITTLEEYALKGISKTEKRRESIAKRRFFSIFAVCFNGDLYLILYE